MSTQSWEEMESKRLQVGQQSRPPAVNSQAADDADDIFLPERRRRHASMRNHH
jgi:hypothetical protein